MDVEAYIGEIRIFAGTFAPRGWHICDGTILPVAQYNAVYAILGNIYGGSGTQTFGLPDLRGRVVVGAGNGTGLSPYQVGQTGGSETVTLTSAQIPAHTHPVTVTASVLPKAGTTADTNQAAECYFADSPSSLPIYTETPTPNTFMGALEVQASAQIAQAGGGQGHPNMQPYTALNYIICLQGLFPSRN